MHHIHLDPLGGIAGDMFAAAILHAFPQYRSAAIEMANELADVACTAVEHADGNLTGLRFHVEQQQHNRQHEHAHWANIRGRIERSDLASSVQDHAIGIFLCLAEAEARVHGVPLPDVTFHEVGAADSIADIVAAAAGIAAIGPATWSVSSLPMGSGHVRTAHGLLPVPAPATTYLLEGFLLHDDGIAGERITPTGAAILRYLNPSTIRPRGILRASGFGFGTRRLPGLSNCLRVLAFDTLDQAAAPAHRELSVVCFEVDDQSGEDLAAGLDRIRTAEGVHDVVQMAAIGKKGRMAVHVQVLARPESLDAVIEQCFRETTTIGLRTHDVLGRALPRRFADVSVAEHDLRVKLVVRPDGTITGKAESDHLLHLESHAARSRLRRAAEHQAEQA